ncbi:unnamed protein product [Camellia sinensis]
MQVTILSIDGGGIRGVIPLEVLQFLERELEILENGNKQKQEGEASNKKARLADYFDVIAGTSAGALITSLLAIPSPRTAEEIIDLFYKEGPKIFSNPGDIIEENSEQDTTPTSLLGKAVNSYYNITKKTVKELLAGRPKVIIDNVMEPIRAILDPVYTGKHLNEVAEKVLGKDTLLKDLSTNIVIPTYDVQKDSPVVFTTRLAKDQNWKIKLKDVVVSSASAPYYFPPNKFEVDGKHYNLVDGGVVANDPRQVTILSIDGGGIRGILENGNKQKQEGEASNKKARLADYFDVIAGTSAGALITSLLAIPSPRTAEEIIDLFYKEGPKIFSNPGDIIEENSEQDTTPTRCKAVNSYYNITKKTVKELLAGRPKVIIDNVMEPIRAILDPVYTGKHLNEVAEKVLGKDTLLKDLSTNIVIPTYDVQKDSPVVFTTRLAKDQNWKIKLKDVVVSSASAPYYFPPNKFEVDGKHYNLVDGGVVANDP